MSRISFFSALSNHVGGFERSAINSTSERADAAMEVASAQGDAFGNAISKLQGQVHQQRDQIKMLHAAIGVLVSALHDNGVVNGEVLDARLEAAMLNAEEEAQHADNTVVCAACQQSVPKNQTTFSELGVICDRCAATR